MYVPKRFFNFDIVGVLGSGSYGSVLAAVDYITGTDVAIKFVKKEKALDGHKFTFEPKIQSVLDHRNICKLYGCLDVSDSLVLILEHVKGIDLHRYLKRHGRMDEEHARTLFIQILDAVDYLHTHSIVHRDLKLENVIVEDGGNVKICDFGLSTLYDKYSVLRDYCGTPQCAPPEIMNGIPYVGPEVDVWCLGVILYAMVHGRLPFEQKDGRSLNKHIVHAKMTVDEMLSSDLRDLIRRLIEPKRTMRIGMDEIARHPWVDVVRTRHRQAIVFVDSSVVGAVAEMEFRREDILKNIIDKESKESAVYSLVERKISLGYRPGGLCRIIPHHVCDLVDLDFVQNLGSSREHGRKMEIHKILQAMGPVRRRGCLAFLFWGRRRMFVVKRDLNARMEESRTIVERCLLGLQKTAFQRGPKYVVRHPNSVEVVIELVENTPFTTCRFLLASGDRLEFAEFVVDFIHLANQSVTSTADHTRPWARSTD